MQNETALQAFQQTNDQEALPGGDEIIIGTAEVVQRLKSGELPLHVQKLYQMENFTAEEKAQIAALYEAWPRSFNEVANMTVQVWGAIIYEHLAYRKNLGGGKAGPVQPGYFNVMLLCSEEGKDEFFILRSSSGGLGMHVMNMIALREKEGKNGWYLWDEPVKYRAQLGKDNSHRLTNVDKPKFLAERKSGKK